MQKLFVLMLVTIGLLACSEVNIPSHVVVENGALPGRFSINDSIQIRFSQGNLQYQASTRIWQFAEHQYDTIGAFNANISESYNGWIDLFGWGTGDNPAMSKANFRIYDTFTDWGVNAIRNGGNETHLWRTLTREEWVYLFSFRPHAESLFGLGSVNGVNGIIILPDTWKTPQGVSFTPSTAQGLFIKGESYCNENEDNFSHNTYTAEQWEAIEIIGAVFLPAAGKRRGAVVAHTDSVGCYWSSTCNPELKRWGWCLNFNSSSLNSLDASVRFDGLSVRLVR